MHPIRFRAFVLSVAASVLMLASTAHAAQPLGTSFTYQGELRSGGLTADEQEPSPRHLPGFARGRELLDRSTQVEEERASAQRRARARGARLEAVDLPRVQRPGPQRQDPGVRAIEGAELGPGGELVEALGDDERRLGHAEGLAHGSRGVGTCEAPEGKGRREPPGTDANEAETRRARYRP